MESFDLTVTEIRDETPLIRALRLVRPSGGPLPYWQPGPHIKVRLPFRGERGYSLISDDADPRAGIAPTTQDVVLLAGGIGITPILSMAAALSAASGARSLDAEGADP